MRYDDFRAAWESALGDSQLRRFAFPRETLDTSTLDRLYEVRVEPVGGQDAEPFLVMAHLSWRWTALHTARTVSCEEDCLTALLGRRGGAQSDRPRLRVDINLSATLAWGKGIPLPAPKTWAAWVREAVGRLERIEPLLPKKAAREGRKGTLEILAWREDPELEVTCAPDGTLKLDGVSLAAGQLLTLPRQWSDDEKHEAPPDKQLRELFARLKASLRAWTEVMDHLRPHGGSQ